MNIDRTKSVAEHLSIINKLPKAQIIPTLKSLPDSFHQLLGYALHPNVVWLLPEGDPPPITETPHNSDMTTLNFLSEVRKLYLFCKRPNDALSDARRQQLFIQMLEFIHPEDRKLLCAIKDKKWPYKNITLDVAKEVAPNLFAGV